MSHSEGEKPDLSIIIPSYNSATWLPSTLEACAVAVRSTGWSVEVLVVDDGSTDGTAELVQGLSPDYPVPLRLVQQENQGRFLARWAGLEASRAERVLLLDSRVLLGAGSLAHAEETIAAHPEKSVWNGHCITDPAAPLVGHFWEVITHAFWRRYLRNPAPVEFGLENYNDFPKGTTLFMAPRDLLVEACRAAWPTGNAALMSDDTQVIRHIAARVPLRLDPGFWAIYRPRGNVRDFVRHSFGRGTVLVDSFAGTSPRWNIALVVLAVAPPVGLGLAVSLAATSSWSTLAALTGGGVLALAAPAAVAARGGCPARGIRSYLTYAPVFALPYWAGLLRGLRVHGRLLGSAGRNLAVKQGSAA